MNARAQMVTFFILTTGIVFMTAAPLKYKSGTSKMSKTTASALDTFLEHMLQAEPNLAWINKVVRNSTDTEQPFTQEQEFEPLNEVSSYKETKQPAQNPQTSVRRQYFDNFYSGRTEDEINNASLDGLFNRNYPSQSDRQQVGQMEDFENQNSRNPEKERKFSETVLDNDRIYQRDKAYPDLKKSSPSIEDQSQTENERDDLKEANAVLKVRFKKLKNERNPENSFESSYRGHHEQDMSDKNENDYGNVDELQRNNDDNVQMGPRVKDQNFQKEDMKFSKSYNEQLREFQNKSPKNLNTFEITKSTSKYSPLLLQEYDSEQLNMLNTENRQRRGTVKKSAAIFDENDDEQSENSAADDDPRLTEDRSSFLLGTGSDSIENPTLTIPDYISSNILQKLRQQDKSLSSISSNENSELSEPFSRSDNKDFMNLSPRVTEEDSRTFTGNLYPQQKELFGTKLIDSYKGSVDRTSVPIMETSGFENSELTYTDKNPDFSTGNITEIQNQNNNIKLSTSLESQNQNIKDVPKLFKSDKDTVHDDTKDSSMDEINSTSVENTDKPIEISNTSTVGKDSLISVPQRSNVEVKDLYSGLPQNLKFENDILKKVEIEDKNVNTSYKTSTDLGLQKPKGKEHGNYKQKNDLYLDNMSKSNLMTLKSSNPTNNSDSDIKSLRLNSKSFLSAKDLQGNKHFTKNPHFKNSVQSLQGNAKEMPKVNYTHSSFREMNSKINDNNLLVRNNKRKHQLFANLRLRESSGARVGNENRKDKQ